MTITVNLKYSWRIKHGKSNAQIRDYGEASGAIDFKDDELKLSETGKIEGKEVQAMITGLKRALCTQVIESFSTDVNLKADLAFIAWKLDVYKLTILGVEVS
jgi:hypothetical protein